nr:unnamed protein product [Spirometra erinaceieuropaei]
MRGAEAANVHGSDHVLVRTRLKVHLSSAPKMPRPRRLNVANIRPTSTAEALSRVIRTCFTARADGEFSNQWSSLKTSVYGAAEKILGSWIAQARGEKALQFTNTIAQKVFQRFRLTKTAEHSNDKALPNNGVVNSSKDRPKALSRRFKDFHSVNVQLNVHFRNAR